MLFAAIDFIQYWTSSGIHAPERFRKSELLNTIAQRLDPSRTYDIGTVLLVRTNRSSLSWLVLYFTGSPVSHICIVGPRPNQVSDMTISGVTLHPVADYFGEDYCVWVVRQDSAWSESERAKLIQTIKKYEDAPYSWRTVFTKGLIILFGPGADLRWRLICDIAIAYSVLFALTRLVSQTGGYVVAVAAVCHVFWITLAKLLQIGTGVSFRLDYLAANVFLSRLARNAAAHPDANKRDK